MFSIRIERPDLEYHTIYRTVSPETQDEPTLVTVEGQDDQDKE